MRREGLVTTVQGSAPEELSDAVAGSSSDGCAVAATPDDTGEESPPLLACGCSAGRGIVSSRDNILHIKLIRFDSLLGCIMHLRNSG